MEGAGIADGLTRSRTCVRSDQRDGDPDRYQRAVRWLGRFALEARDVTIEGLRLAAEALDALRDRTGEAMERLQRLCVAHGVG